MKKKKKWKGILITLVVLALLGGGGYAGVKRYMAGREKSVDVFAVRDLNGADWLSYYSDTTSSGTIVSDVSQNVYVPEDKVVNEVYVSEGDEVKIGDKLLSYDTTLLELDRELQDLELQELDLELEAAEADLKKLQNTTPVAYKPEEDYEDYLDPDDFTLPDDFEDEGDEEARMLPGERAMRASYDGGTAEPQTSDTAAATENTEPAADTESVPAETTEGAADGSAQTGMAEGAASGNAETGATEGAASSNAETGATEGASSGNAETGATEGASSGNTETGATENTAGGSAETDTAEGASGSGAKPQKGTEQAPAEEEQIIGEEQNPSDTWDFGDLDDFFGPQNGGTEEDGNKPKMNQSLLLLLSHIRVKEDSGQEESEQEGTLLADTRREAETGEPETAKLSEEQIDLVPHFAETAEAHFERLNTYVMRIKGITLKEEKAGKVYGIARINGEDYPEIGGYTMIQDPEDDDVVFLTLAFHDGLNEQHEISAELEDIYAKITLSADEIVGEELIFRTKKKENDITIAVEKTGAAAPAADTDESDSGSAGGDETGNAGGDDSDSTGGSEPGNTEDTGAENPGGSDPAQTEPESGAGAEPQTEPESGAATGPQTEPESGAATEPQTEYEAGAGTEPESETGTEPQTEQIVAATSQILFDVTWYHGTNEETFWPRSLTIEVYDMEDSAQENLLWTTTVPRDNAPEETPELNTEAETENPAGDNAPAKEKETVPDIPDIDSFTDDGEAGAENSDSGADSGEAGSDAADVPAEMDYAVEGEIEHVIGLEENTYSSTHLRATRNWDTSLGEPDLYRVVVKAEDSLDYIPGIEWGTTDEQGTRPCTITMKYLEPQESPLVKLEPLSELTYKTGTKGYYYKGSGTKDDPYVFFCTDGAVIKNTFVNWVLGFDADGLVREREGCYVLLEIRESDTITGAFIRSVGLDGTILMDHGYGPGTYWIFASDSGITRYEEDIPDPEEDDDFDDPGWEDWGDTYTAEELEEAIKDKEREIRRLNLDIKEGEMKLKQYDRDLDGSVVVSAVDGYVKSLGGTNGEAYMVVTNEGGLYLRTSVSELDLDTVKVGDTLNVTSWESGDFTASVTEVSTYPSSSDMYYSYGGGQNPNSSNYPVLARIDDTSGLSPYEYVQVKFRQPQTASNSIYITVMYVRSENGQSYVYKVDENKLLKKQYVRTGRTIDGYLEIKDGLTNEDYIAFPYGKAVKDGAKTQSTDEDEGEEF